MTTDYRAMCAELLADYEQNRFRVELAAEARALLDQPVTEGPKPMVDYSRVPEIATEAQIRSAAQYLVKKRNCDGDLIPAIEYAIARWGRPTPQPVAVSERLPGPEDCDEQGRCWWFRPATPILNPYWDFTSKPDYPTHWLPANALPTPKTTEA